MLRKSVKGFRLNRSESHDTISKYNRMDSILWTENWFTNRESKIVIHDRLQQNDILIQLNVSGKLLLSYYLLHNKKPISILH